MAFDGLFTKAMTEELASTLTDGKITKIHQPYKNELVVTIRANRKNHRLLLSAHPSYARVQLTNEGTDNPGDPPMFCMLLRKHIDGAIIESVEQYEMDRMIVFTLRGRNELGDVSYKKLVIEIMGRHSNILLVDMDSNKIIDCIKHIPTALNSYRTLLPGADYIYPPPQDKLDPLTANEEDVLRQMDFNQGKLDQQIVQAFSGFSPDLAREIIFQTHLANRETLPPMFVKMCAKFASKQYEPTITKTKSKEAFHILPFTFMAGENETYSSLSEMLDTFYFGKADRDRVKQQANDLEKFMKNERAKNVSKIKKLKRTLEYAEQADDFQLYGELLTAYMHELKRGMKEIAVHNYYHEDNEKIMIPLDSRKNPAENAQAYYSKYQKAKNSVQVVNEQMDKAQLEIDYFDSLIQQVESASTKDIEEIRDELAEGGYLRSKGKKKERKQINKKPELERYTATDGTEVFVGKNNKQNDYLTNKFARRDEIWLHTKDIPGSHVVIRSEEPSEETIQEAAHLAAYFSKAKNSASVPVDFTKVRHVKKPNGAKPGFVIYDQQQTVYVTPDAKLVQKLKSI